MRHFRLIVQYDGTDYCGFQVQPGVPTIQQEIEQALETVLNERIRIRGASRTDAGVHALGQVVKVVTGRPIPADGLVRSLNDVLPDAVCVTRAERVPASFHPQYDAQCKQYCYHILNRPLPSPFRGRYSWHVTAPLDIGSIQQAAVHLTGRHDFSAFEAAGSSAKDKQRTLSDLSCRREGHTIKITAECDGFLYKMMRIIVGTLVEVGLGRMHSSRIADILASKDRTAAGPTAPAHGLWLVQVRYGTQN